MYLNCTNKGCYANDEHCLDEEENEVYCIECGEQVNVPSTTKAILKSLRQIKRRVKSGVQFTCKQCNTTDKPMLKKMGDEQMVAACRKCEAQLEIHPSFIQAMKVMKEEYMDREDERGAGN